MATASEIGKAGEQTIVNNLKSDGWNIDKWDTKAPGSTDIEASKNKTAILVQVKSAVAPAEPASLSADELKDIKARAARLSRTAYASKVKLNPQTLASTSINYEKLA